ncbi:MULTISPECIES: DUF1441 family protein [Actinobacillus]|uniref:Terminase small subunit n=2 Tax=Actinobacillus suis TaxID=716 RepID=K0G373_ACTSU|nr:MULTISPECIES: DUF1441 family protein [Actinobacillus]AFU18681.1 hypothetical protein ASU2_02695 [Actinobacillus suis H91-0380]MCO4167083.1 DUF1441 family protein [Actinobacillus suis]MCO4169206.1 DUF1441 family protein [Actinobacillus suis]MCQ9629810.1 DUF1441 family protein [Actinobacillus suis]MCQ9632246.1 DUF1441 family protein [Actinobacillus suis]
MENFHELKLNINQIAEITGMHRQTVSQRVSPITPAQGSNPKLKLYLLRDLLMMGFANKMLADVDSMTPSDQLSYWRAKREELEYKKRTNELCEATEVALEMSAMAKAIVQQLETLPDILERDAGLPPKALIRVQELVDDFRDQLAIHIQNADSEPEEE